jgi:hypothetical protein
MTSFQSVQKEIILDPKKDCCIVTKEEFFVTYLSRSWFRAYDKIIPGITKISIDLVEKKNNSLYVCHCIGYVYESPPILSPEDKFI